ncbi:WecB/TagA/CpsF family glycosyltransferase [Geodermatophilus sp. SYSU D00708]
MWRSSTISRNPTNSRGEPDWAESLATELLEQHAAGRGRTVTWLNHHTVQTVLDSGLRLDEFDYIGIDGLYLVRLLGRGSLPRTSADLVIPRLLDRAKSCPRLALIGTTTAALNEASQVISCYASNPKIVLALNGFDELLDVDALAQSILSKDIDFVILGLGSPLQDSYALGLQKAGCSQQLILTCGGWLDQVGRENYYPPFAYRFKVNWLIRLVREPRRLWRRYTIRAALAARRRSEIRDALEVRNAPGVGRYLQSVTEA